VNNEVNKSLISVLKSLHEDEGIDVALEFALDNYLKEHEFTGVIAQFYEQKRDWDNVFYWCNKALEYNIESYKVYFLLSSHYLGLYYNKDKNKNHLLNSLKFAKLTENLALKEGREMTSEYFNMGFLYFILNEYKRALVYFRKAMKQGHVYSEMYFIAIMFDLKSMPINPLKLLCLAFRIRIKKQILMWTDKEDMRLDKGFLNGNQILGDESILSGWARRFKNRKGTSKVNLR